MTGCSPRQTKALSAFVKLVRAAESVLERVMARAPAREQDLTTSQFGVMEALYHVGPMCQRDLGSKILRSEGNITFVLDNLERRELIIRVREKEDRRYFRVQLTVRGRALIRKIFPRHAAIITEEMSVLSSHEQEKLGELCRKLGKALKGMES